MASDETRRKYLWSDDVDALKRLINESYSLVGLTALLDTLPTETSEDGHVLCDLATEQALRILARTTGQLDEVEQLIAASDKIGKWYA